LCILQDTVLTMLEHGKAVLCEKPIGLTGGQAEEMADFAKEMVCYCAHMKATVLSHALRCPRMLLCVHGCMVVTDSWGSNALQGLFLLEGHWDRFFPATQAVRAAIKRGLIGKCVPVYYPFCICPVNRKKPCTAAY
jgi:predicted dehydrogenase